MCDFLDAKILSKKVTALNYLNLRIKEADLKGVTYINAQGSLIPIEKGSVIYEEFKLQRQNLELEIAAYTIIKEPDPTIVLPKTKLGKPRKQQIESYVNPTKYDMNYVT